MRVIKKGEDKVYKMTCEFCKSDLEYTEKDVIYTEEEHKGGLIRIKEQLFKPTKKYYNVEKRHYKNIICPVCNRMNKEMIIDFANGRAPKTIRWECEE